MPDNQACPRCGATYTLQLGPDPTSITYDHAEWSERCQYPKADGLTSCPPMLSALPMLLPQLPQRERKSELLADPVEGLRSTR